MPPTRIAVIPARGGSKRLPRKNVLPVLGKPMISYPVRAALDSGVFERVIVSTEDAAIADTARSAGAEVLPRRDELATDQATVTQVCLDVLEQVGRAGALPESFCCIYATAIFLEARDLSESLRLLDVDPRCEGVMGVSRYPIHPYKALQWDDGYLKAMWPEQNERKSQEYPDLVASNGTLYWARSAAFRRNPTFYAMRLRGYVVPAARAVDIDTPEDYEWAQRLAESRKAR
jgi:CMP-N-acetylneuraminic acid synthetase